MTEPDVSELTPAERLVLDFHDRAVRSRGTPSEWYWNTAAAQAAQTLGVDRKKVQRYLSKRDPSGGAKGGGSPP